MMVQKSKMHKESEDLSPTFHQGRSNYGCSSALWMIQRLLAEPFALCAHAVQPLMPFVVSKSAFRLLSNMQEMDTAFSDREVRGMETAPLFAGGSLSCLVTDGTRQPSSSRRGFSSWGQSSATEHQLQIMFCTGERPVIHLNSSSSNFPPLPCAFNVL